MSFNIKVKQNKKTGEYYILLPKKLLAKTGWKTGDQIEWINNKDNSFSLVKYNNDTVTLGGNKTYTTNINYNE